MDEPPRASRAESLSSHAAAIAVAASFCVYLWNLWSFVSRNAVDVLHWDLWDVLNPFFHGEGLWAAFQYQPGPHRQGLGALLFAASNAMTAWSMRAAAFEIVVILAIAALLALELKVAIFGKLSWSDALIPPILFRMGQAAGLVFAPYPACVAFPAVFVLLACRILLVRSERLALAMLALLCALASYTGFAMFLPPALVAVLGLRGVLEWTGGQRAAAAATARKALVVVVSAVPALVGLDRRGFGQLPCPDGAPALTDYAAYVVTMINGSFGIFRRDPGATLLGALVFVLPLAAVVALCIRGAVEAIRRRDEPSGVSRALVPLVLIAFSLVFSVSSSIGRVCEPGAALASRYVALMAPLGIGLYFGVLSWQVTGARARSIRSVLVALLVVVTLAGAAQISVHDEQFVERTVTGKLRWIECVKSGGSAAECNERAQFETHPAPDGSGIDAKLEFLRRHRLSLFAPRNDAPAAK